MVAFSRRTTATRTGVKGGVVVEGLDEVVQSFTRSAATIRPRSEGVVVEYAERLANKMRDRVPVDEGDVLDSITSDDRASRDGLAVYADAGPDPRANKAAFVARFLEHGTVNMSPREFVRPSADAVVPEFRKAIRDLL